VIGQPPMGRPYSPGILAGDTLYVSGKGDQNADGSHPGTFEAQVRQCMKNVEATLKEAGLDFRHVVMSHVFLDDPKNREVAAKVYNEFFDSSSAPAKATTLVDWIPGGSHVEVTCIATTDLASRKVVKTEGTSKASAAVWAGNTLYLSGAYPSPDQQGLAEQVHGLGRYDEAILQMAGLSLSDIVSGHVYLADMEDYQGMNTIYKEYFSKGPGVRTTLMPTKNKWDMANSARIMAHFIAAKTQPAK
jgi:2-iminobutanoate/2-iminopropanoate deaminase